VFVEVNSDSYVFKMLSQVCVKKKSLLPRL